MDITLTPEQSDIVRQAVESGRVHDSRQAVEQAIALWVERERRRAELVTSLEAAEASLSRGEGIVITRDSMEAMVRDVIDRCARRLSPDGP